MGSRSWLFSDGELCAAALLSPHCFPKPPHAADWHVYHLRLSHIEERPSHIEERQSHIQSGYHGWKFGREGVARVLEGLPG